MEVVWLQTDPVAVGGVLAALPAEPHIAYNTVKTTMERLAEKGILSRTKEGKAYLYKAAISREDLERRIVSRILDNLVEQFPNAVASFFTAPKPEVSHDHLALLLEAIERQRGGDNG